MKKHRFLSPLTVFVILICLVLGGLLCYLIPWNTPVELTFYAVETDKDRNVLSKGYIHISGTWSDYLFQQDVLRNCSITLLDESVSLEDHSMNIGGDRADRFTLHGADVHVSESGNVSLDTLLIYLSGEQDCCYVVLEKGYTKRYFYGNLGNTIDPGAIAASLFASPSD